VIQRPLLHLLLVASYPACGSPTPHAAQPALNPLLGMWFNNARPADGGISVQLQLGDEPNRRIAGTASIAGSFRNQFWTTCPSSPDGGFVVAGQLTGADVTLTMTCPGYVPLTFTGKLLGHSLAAPQRIVGSLGGSGVPFTNCEFSRLGEHL